MPKPKYTKSIFKVRDLYLGPVENRAAYDAFCYRLELLAKSMTSLLPEYNVEAEIWIDQTNLVFTRVEPPEEE